MKNKALLYCILFTNIALFCSEQKNELDLIKQIDYKKIEQTLHENYITYACKCLEEYKTTDYTPEKMWEIGRKQKFMTGAKYPSLPYNAIRDKDGNNFIRIAVNKMDLPIVDWHVLKQGAHCITRKDFDYCIGQCVLQLKTMVSEDLQKKNTAYNILKILGTKQGNRASIFVLNEKPCREHFIKQLILLQIKHKKYYTEFPSIEEEFIQQYTTAGDKDSSPIILKDMYQQIVNNDGNTLSHLLVNLQNADELYDLIKKHYVSPTPNKAGKTILDLALHHFQMFTQDPSNFDTYPEKVKQSRCCLFMLLKYIKLQNGINDSNYTCCDKHVITA